MTVVQKSVQSVKVLIIGKAMLRRIQFAFSSSCVEDATEVKSMTSLDDCLH